MKVAYNACFGGFGLSEAGLRMLAALKNIDLSGMKFDHSSFHNKDWTVIFSAPDDRSDKDLIKVIEALGAGAGSSCADLAIQEIPDGAEFEIDEYDGNESVVQPRQAW